MSPPAANVELAAEQLDGASRLNWRARTQRLRSQKEAACRAHLATPVGQDDDEEEPQVVAESPDHFSAFNFLDAAADQEDDFARRLSLTLRLADCMDPNRKNRKLMTQQQQQQQQQAAQDQLSCSPHWLTLEDLKVSRNSCWLCGCNWQADHVSLDCPECDGYALTRPCPSCDGRCQQVWRRNIRSTHDRHKADWEGQCSLAKSADQLEVPQQAKARRPASSYCSSAASSEDESDSAHLGANPSASAATSISTSTSTTVSNKAQPTRCNLCTN